MVLKLYYPTCVLKILETESTWGVFDLDTEDENFYLIIPSIFNPVLYDSSKFNQCMSKIFNKLYDRSITK
jgi:hypothetical protein